MARIWKEPFDSVRHGGSAPKSFWRARTLQPHFVILVHVCSFTFYFHSPDQIQECLAFFEKKIIPSGRRPMPGKSDSFDHWHAQAWFEKLPMYLREEPKRRKVQKALQEAMALLAAGKL
jgi:hypothetical protein